MLDVPAWEPNSLAPFFVLINISISTQQKKTHKQQKARLEGETFNYCVPTHFTIWAAVVLRMGCQSDSARPANPEVCTFSEKQRALIISWRTLDNKFSIKMSLNGREQGCFEAFLPLVRLLVLSTELRLLARLLLSLYACHEAAFGPTRSWQYHASAANLLCSLIVFNEGKKRQSTINELGMLKKKPPFAENCIKLLVQGKLWLELIQNLMKDPYKDRAGGGRVGEMQIVLIECTESPPAALSAASRPDLDGGLLLFGRASV